FPLGDPLLAAAVHDSDVLVPVDLELPEGPCREPVVVVAVQNDGGLVADTALAQQLLELFARYNIANERVAELRRPVPSGGACDVTLIVRGRIDVDLDDANSCIGCVLRHPVGGHENVCCCSSGHRPLLCKTDILSRARPGAPPAGSQGLVSAP